MKDKTINIIIILVAIVAILGCVYYVVSRPDIEAKEYVVVKDMSEEGDGRLISNKTDVLSNTDGKTLVYNGDDIKDKILNPEDVIDKDKPNSGDKPATDKNQTTYDIPPTPPIKVRPVLDTLLPMLEIGETLEIISEIPNEVTEEEEQPQEELPPIYMKSLNLVLSEARAERNKGRAEVPLGLSLDGFVRKSITINDIAENGLLIIPFTVGDTAKIEYISKFLQEQGEYLGEINVIFVEDTFEKLGSVTKMVEDFEKYSVGYETLNIYFDEYQEIRMSTNYTIDTGYILINRDGYVYSMKDMKDGFDSLGQEIKAVQDENEEFKVADEEITKEYEIEKQRKIDEYYGRDSENESEEKAENKED